MTKWPFSSWPQKQVGYRTTKIMRTASHCSVPYSTLQWQNGSWLLALTTKTGLPCTSESCVQKWSGQKQVCHAPLKPVYNLSGDVDQSRQLQTQASILASTLLCQVVLLSLSPPCRITSFLASTWLCQVLLLSVSPPWIKHSIATSCCRLFSSWPVEQLCGVRSLCPSVMWWLFCSERKSETCSMQLLKQLPAIPHHTVHCSDKLTLLMMILEIALFHTATNQFFVQRSLYLTCTYGNVLQKCCTAMFSRLRGIWLWSHFAYVKHSFVNGTTAYAMQL